jgi:hypothetical protein
VIVEEDFVSAPFLLVEPASLNGFLPPDIPAGEIVADQFPPLKDWRGIRRIPASWLGVRSPALQLSNKRRSAILGALALKPSPSSRYMFSARDIFGGRCTLDSSATVSFGEPHTPPMMRDIVVGTNDHGWLAVLADKFVAPDRAIRRQVRALEYFYRAWPLGPTERFPWLLMTLDALFGDQGKSTNAAVEAMSQSGAPLSVDRLSYLLKKLRAEVMHGRAPDVYDCEQYQEYHELYCADPINDLERVTATCLNRTIFEGALPNGGS